MANAALQPVIARASTALERGQAAVTIELLSPLLRTPATLSRDDELGVRVILAESYLLQGDLAQAGTVLGRSPDTIRENLPQVLAAGFTRIAVAGAITTAADPAAEARQLAKLLKGN